MREISVQRSVENIIMNRPCILEAIKLGIINFSGLARLIEPEVRERVGRKVTLASIKMALFRYYEFMREREKRLEKDIQNLLAKSTLQLISDIIVITFKEKIVYHRLNEILNKIEEYRFFQLTQGIGYITIVMDEESFKKLYSVIQHLPIEVLIENQAALILTSPKDIINIPGVISYLSFILASNGINITQIISCHIDTIFVIERNLALKSYELLEKLILGFRFKLQK